MAKNLLLIHILDADKNEVGTGRAKTFSQEFSWKHRMFPIDPSAKQWTDKKGVGHLFVDANESDGTIRFLSPQKVNLIKEAEGKVEVINQCTTCGGKISYDARNVRDLLKRKTIDTFWGLDSSHILLLLVMGIIAIGAFGGLFYLLGQNQNLQSQLNKYLPTAEEIKASKQNTVPKLILGEIILVN